MTRLVSHEEEYDHTRAKGWLDWLFAAVFGLILVTWVSALVYIIMRVFG